MSFAIYRVMARAAELAAAGLTTFVPPTTKFSRALHARRGLLTRYAEWGATHRRPEVPLLWMHAPSVGEGLMALPILQHFREQYPASDLQIAYTYFSPSAERFAQSIPADFRAYLPFDSPHSAQRALSALRPSALVFSKTDVWPTFVLEAHRAGVKTGLVSAVLADSSSRRSILASAALRPAYRILDAIGAASHDDAQRLAAAGADPSCIQVTGDTRYDQAWTRAHVTNAHQALRNSLTSPRATLVAGSTWPADEAHLLEAWLGVRAQLPSARLIIAPHEIDSRHVTQLQTWSERHGLSSALIAPPSSTRATHPIGSADVIIVNTTGMLAELYDVATVAYVGGGFHRAGLHSVVEPAVFSVPTLVGPNHHASRDAVSMIREGGVIAVSDTNAMTAALLSLFQSSDEHQQRARAMDRIVIAERGATIRSAALIEKLLFA